MPRHATLHPAVLTALLVGLLPLACSDSNPAAPLTAVEISEDWSGIADPYLRWQAYGLRSDRIAEGRACECLPPYAWTAYKERGEREADRMRVEYDPRFGYPSTINIDWRLAMADEETLHGMRDLARLVRR